MRGIFWNYTLKLGIFHLKFDFMNTICGIDNLYWMVTNFFRYSLKKIISLFLCITIRITVVSQDLHTIVEKLRIWKFWVCSFSLLLCRFGHISKSWHSRVKVILFCASMNAPLANMCLLTSCALLLDILQLMPCLFLRDIDSFCMLLISLIAMLK